MSGSEKRCVDCRHCDWPEFATGSQSVIELTAACFHPDAMASRSPVVGTGSGRPCWLMRQFVAGEAGARMCGPEAAWFEAKTERAKE